MKSKKDNEGFESSTKCWICDNDYIYGIVKLRDNCHMSGKYRGLTQRECSINVKLNRKIPLVFHNLKSYDSPLITQELGKFSSKLSVIPNGLEKYMNFSVNNKLSFTDSFPFLSSSLDSLVRDLGKEKIFYPYEHMSNFEKLKEKLSMKKSLIVH